MVLQEDSGGAIKHRLDDGGPGGGRDSFIRGGVTVDSGTRERDRSGSGEEGMDV